MTKQTLAVAFSIAIAVSAVTASIVRAGDDGKHYKVFILAGQSNAQGKAPIPMMDAQAEAPATKDLYKHLRKDGKWVVRDDVFCEYQKNKKGPLTVGFGSAGRVGSELEFGFMMGDRFEEPVMVLKICWGGMSLFKNFRPPSSGLPPAATLEKELEQAQARVKAANEKNKKNDPLPTMDDIKNEWGKCYRAIFTDYKEMADTYGNLFPALKGRTPELAGFVWFQGWNDQYNGYEKEYEVNLKNLIKDIRKDFNAPKLPFVIVAMGQNGSTPAAGAMLTIREAQMAMNDVPEFKGNVKAFRSDLLVDKDAERYATEKDPAARARDKEAAKLYASDEAYHYFGSAIWYMRIGHAMGEAMLELMEKQDK